ncbi:MAG TPA: hypothetical protein VFZ42_06045 [Chitinophagaceae bacterium]
MNLYARLFVTILLLSFASSCNTITYTPRGKKNIQKEKPSPALLDKIVSFREDFNSWPFSKEEMTGKGGIYRTAFDGFPYMQVRFKVIDHNNMVFYFSDHRRDVQNYKETQKIDLNSYGGEVKFYKEKEKFIWKIKMY